MTADRPRPAPVLRSRHRPGPAPDRPVLARRRVLAAGAALPLATAGLAACGDGEDDGGGEEPDLSAELPREEPGPAEGSGALVSPFTARLLAALPRDAVNLVCSPLSAQIALTMAGLGAAGATRAQMEDVLGGSIDELAESANTLASVLAAVGDAQREEADDDAPEPARASLVNGTWLQQGLEIEQAFLEGLAAHFGSGVYEVDFTDGAAREEGRERINSWVEDATHGLVEDLVPEGSLTEDSRLMLVDALHLKAAWSTALGREGGSFTTAEGEELSVEMLHGETSTWYEDDLVRATSLEAYGDELALALVRPVADPAAVLEGWAGSAEDAGGGLAALLGGLEDSSATVELAVPGFDIEWDEELTSPLTELGMADAFSADADFSGITASERLAITSVMHKAVITVDENGMEAAAATAVGVGAVSAPVDVKELVLDAPFLYVAYERSTLAPLVLGWIGDPTQTR